MRRIPIIALAALGFFAVDWSPSVGQLNQPVRPVRVAALATPAGEEDPYLDVPRRGRGVRRLFFVTLRDGHRTILVSEYRKEKWQPPRIVQGPNPEVDNRCPCLSDDGRTLYFAPKFVVRTEQGGRATDENYDLGFSTLTGGLEQFSEPVPIQLACTPADEMSPWIIKDGTELYFSRREKDGWRMYVARRAKVGTNFGPPRRIDEFPANFHHATLTSDGLVMILEGPLDGGRSGLYRARRSRAGAGNARWSRPEPLDSLNAPAGEARLGDRSPALSRDDRELVFSSDRRSAEGVSHLWIALAPSLIKAAWKAEPPASEK